MDAEKTSPQEAHEAVRPTSAVRRFLGTEREPAEVGRLEFKAFDACPDPEVVSHGRRYLGMYLN